jgi:DNA-binding response OmpR family regulator/anti-sigma regulatory factor (Ser/Thr protein kinase)
MKLQTSCGDIVSYIKGIMMSFQAIAERKQIKYQFISDKKEIVMYFDQDKIEKMFYNLLSNAFKFTPSHGEVSVRVRERSENGEVGSIKISVTDTGRGIDKEQLPHIFDRFYQVDDSSIRDHEGSGIGLALIKELVEIHHGSIRVQSTVHRGSKFTVALPLGKDHLKDEEIIEQEVLVGRSDLFGERWIDLPVDEAIYTDSEMSKVKRPIILIVEDNRDMSTFIREHLKPYYIIKEAFDGEEGLEKAKEIIPDLVISDIMMPKKDGYELCQNLKQDEKTSHIPIILLTAKAERKDKLEGLEIGADDYLVKPFDSTELLARVKNLIGLRQKLRERFSRNGKLPRDEMDINPVDKRFVERITKIIEENMSNEEFDIKQFSHLIGMSGTQLRRKMNALIGQSPNQFIRTLRLNEAARLIKEEMKAVSEAAYLAGFNSLSYFSKCFKEEFGKLPSEY